MIKLIDYSEKSVAVFGETKVIKELLKDVGGRYNKFLKYPDENSKSPGWIFKMNKKSELIEKFNENNVSYE
jgi:hypothetical protein